MKAEKAISFKKVRSRRGFTLVEIMIVVVIIGLLAAMAVPAFKRARGQAQETAIKNNMRQIWGAAQQEMMNSGAASVKIGDIVGYMKKGSTTINGNNLGYTSVIKPVLDEDYGLIKCETDPAATITADGDGSIPDGATKMGVGYGRGDSTKTYVVLDI
ncbi:MAG: prepilin-type N-terminal cleavage/methylation domain-containing protein [Puniceicoccales bacterium]|jgi:type IV pilus assembly protein PilA|nr:prepilin-type N-terminal cleavage/methylation domain-containing protein [Puniceicoccales bacterium]